MLERFVRGILGTTSYARCQDAAPDKLSLYPISVPIPRGVAIPYPRSRQILILSGTGGSNGYRCRAWKTKLQPQMADSRGLTLIVAHNLHTRTNRHRTDSPTTTNPSHQAAFPIILV
jgi:hypothetical protein